MRCEMKGFGVQLNLLVYLIMFVVLLEIVVGICVCRVCFNFYYFSFMKENVMCIGGELFVMFVELNFIVCEFLLQEEWCVRCECVMICQCLLM